MISIWNNLFWLWNETRSQNSFLQTKFLSQKTNLSTCYQIANSFTIQECFFVAEFVLLTFYIHAHSQLLFADTYNDATLKL